MTRSERVHRNRCFGLSMAVVFAVVLATLSWPDWPLVAVAVVGGLVALGVYLRDCRESAQESTQTETDTRDS